MIGHCASRALVVLLWLAAFTSVTGSAHAERRVSAYDTRLHIRPPTMRGLDGGAAELVLDADFLEAAGRYKAQHPHALPPVGGVSSVGEVLIVQGDDQSLATDGTGFGLRPDGLAVVMKRALAQIGDQYQAVTIWLTFDDKASTDAEAYEVAVKNEIEGLGRLPVGDSSAAYGSAGVLRSVLNMKAVGLHSGDTMESWRNSLETWGQESSHRWMVYMLMRDPRTGRLSDALLGRDCAHYSRYVDTQGSVHDGFAWRDNGDGTFTWTESNKRYGNLDLYGMGLMAADEVPPFFFIDGIPNYQYPSSCSQYAFTFRPPAQTVSGTRVNVTIDDIVAANGERKSRSSEHQDYWREAEVILTGPSETPDSARVQALAQRIDKTRLFWEQWNRTASRNRLVMCTQTSADCGDPRSDVTKVTFNATNQGPATGPLALNVEVTNTGKRATSGVKTSIEVKAGDRTLADQRDVGALLPAEMKSQAFQVDLRGVPCGTEVVVKASTQSDFHYNRLKTSFLLGAETKQSDGFEAESGWSINPDGDDTGVGAQWERGMPESSEILKAVVQPGTTHDGTSAWVTGLSASGVGSRSALVRDGKATLQSPVYDAVQLRDPLLRYWVTFAGVRGDDTGQGLEASPQSSLHVQARAVGGPATSDAGASDGAWILIDHLENKIGISWTQRTVTLPKELLVTGRLQFRFVAADENPAQGGVEAAIDDLELTSNLPACYLAAPAPDGGVVAPPPGADGCGCRVGGTAGGSPALLVIALLAAALVRRRRCSVQSSASSSPVASPDRSSAR